VDPGVLGKSKKSSPTSYDWDSNRKVTNVKRFTLCVILPVLVLIGSCPAFASNPSSSSTVHYVGIAAAPFKEFGYWAVQSNGKVFNFGCAFFGDASHRHLTQPVVGIVPTNDGKGYWLYTASGKVFAYGDAKFFGPAESFKPSSPIVSMAITYDQLGYWLLGSDGAVYTFGDAPYYGDTKNILKRYYLPAVAITSDGGYTIGYTIFFKDGSFVNIMDQKGGASGPISSLTSPVVGVVVDQMVKWGYWLVTANGSVYSLMDAPSLGTKVNTYHSSIAGFAANISDNGLVFITKSGLLDTLGNEEQH